MDFAPYQSSPPEHSRPFSPPFDGQQATSPRGSADDQNYKYNIRRPFSPTSNNNNNYQQAVSPPPLQHPQPQRSWQPSSEFGGGGHQAGYQNIEGDYYNPGNSGGGAAAGGGGGVSEFDTSLGIRLDYEAALAYVALPPLGAIVLLILERNSDYVRFHAWQSSLLFTVVFVVHLIFSWSKFLSWLIFVADLCGMAWLAMRAYRDTDTLDRFELPVFGSIASRILDDE